METKVKAGETKMAASPGAEEDSVYDTGRLSLFDIILEKTRAQNKVMKTSSHFCILISFCRKITMNYPSKAHLICRCLQVETVNMKVERCFMNLYLHLIAETICPSASLCIQNSSGCK